MSDVMLAGGEVLVNVHPSVVCQQNGDRPCPIHRITDHLMRAFPQHFRMDNGLMERICPHGIGHPDPDALPFFKERGIEGMEVHGCDGCCRGQGPAIPKKHKKDEGFPFNRIP